jgi:hypothetical protein
LSFPERVTARIKLGVIPAHAEIQCLSSARRWVPAPDKSVRGQALRADDTGLPCL